MGKRSFTKGLIIGSLFIAVSGVVLYKFFPHCYKKNALQESEHVKEIVLQLLKNEPEKFIDAMNEGSKRQQEKLKQQIIKDAQKITDVLLNTGFTFGHEKSDIKLVAFIDPVCPHSNTFIKMVYKLLEVKPNVRVQLIPVAILGEQAIMLGKILLSAHLQGSEKLKKFWKELLDTGGELTQEQVNNVAKKVTLNLAVLHKDIMSDRVLDNLKSNGDLLEKLKIPGVPMIMIFDKNNEINILPPLSMDELIKAVENDKKDNDTKR